MVVGCIQPMVVTPIPPVPSPTVVSPTPTVEPTAIPVTWTPTPRPSFFIPTERPEYETPRAHIQYVENGRAALQVDNDGNRDDQYDVQLNGHTVYILNVKADGIGTCWVELASGTNTITVKSKYSGKSTSLTVS